MLKLRFAVVAAVLLAGAPAVAQSSDPAAAQALFDDAKALMRSGNYAEACPKLEQSQRLDPGGGTLVALGLCYEGMGRTASAWTTWNLALSSARSEHRSDREAIALKHIPALEQKMPRARIVVNAPPPGLEVRRDGVAISSAEWGTAVPIDPGQHTFEATAPGKVPWKTLFVIPSEAKTFEFDVPALKDAPAAPSAATAASPATPPAAASAAPASTAPAPAAATPTSAAASGEAATAPSSGHPARTWAWITGGVGVAALAAGGIFGLVASSKWSDAHGACPNNQCKGSTGPAAVSEGTTAGNDADIATVLVAVGGVAVATSAVLFLTSGGDSSATTKTGAVHVAPLVGRVNGLSVTGSLW